MQIPATQPGCQFACQRAPPCAFPLRPVSPHPLVTLADAGLTLPMGSQTDTSSRSIERLSGAAGVRSAALRQRRLTQPRPPAGCALATRRAVVAHSANVRRARRARRLKASHAGAALTRRVGAACIFSRGRAKNWPQKAISHVSANWPARPRQKPAPQPDSLVAAVRRQARGAHSHATFHRSTWPPATATPRGSDRHRADDQPAARAGSGRARRSYYRLAAPPGSERGKPGHGLPAAASASWPGERH
jgi:hypothetical protein